METHTLVRDKLSEWNLNEFIQHFEDKNIDNETFLNLDTNPVQLKELILKIGPRAKFRKRLREYKQLQQSTTPLPVCDKDMISETLGAAMTQEQGVLATTLFVLRHQLTASAQSDLKTLLKCLIPNFTDESKLVFNRITVNKSENNPDNFFLFSSLKELLKDTLKSHGTKLIPKTVNRGQAINDIMDGEMYQSLLRQQELSDDDITLMWNCDGVPVQQCYSIWPLQFTINELPYQIRKQNVLVAGLWCGSGGDPDMTTFLRPFIDECCELAQKPLEWIDCNNSVRYSRVFVLVCSSDAVARPLLRNCKQFNGEYGCDWCLHPGTMVDKGFGKIRSYAYDEQKQSARLKNTFTDNARDANNSGRPVNGVKGYSVLQSLPVFDIVRGFVPEYSHAVLLGVSRQLVFLWLDPENSSQSWYIGNNVDELDRLLLGLRPDIKITRRPISLKCRESWKAVDWQAFLLFYGIYVLQPFLSSTFLEHFHLLSCSAHLLLQDSLTQDDLNLARYYLMCFVKNMQGLYGEENVTFNCHQLIHLCESVQNWGPLWATSALCFEQNNKYLQALLSDQVKNTQDFTERFRIWQHIPKHLSYMIHSDSDFNHVLNPVSPPNDNNIVYSPLGDVCHVILEDSVKLALEDLLKRPVLFKQVKGYKCFTKGQTVYHCANSNAFDKTKCIIKLNNMCYGEIQFFLDVVTHCMCTSNCQCRTSPVIVIQMFDTNPVTLSQTVATTTSANIFVKGERIEQLKALFLSDIKSECVYVKGFIVPIPNKHERY